ncbi:PucR family transcriptional regulator ligand-binding domain-containing protein [Neobacillus novalis]|uniref:PucR family transcriptional regulator ligand-binding domain-containing protein n=1 Tax=Neobacillus novalis TaxID=220687 RepID=A0AA95MNG2_9BACI|nr:PucR family transcriptional regulator [Neobacillus novalis]WHY85165.1 PucR family transcriptional regulator ligand-binding domain-containing protein [Neobacillus novalis]
MKIVEDLFIVDVFQDAEVIAGHAGLKRVVESIEVSETPDVINFLAENSLLLTTGFAFKDDPLALGKFISQMSKHPCAGIAIKLKRFIDVIPKEVVDLANSLEFPIIVIPPSLTLGNVAHQLLSFLWNNKIEELFYAIHIHKKFTDMMIKGYNLQSLIENLGYFLKNPVLLLSPLGDIVSFSQHFHKENMKNMKEHVESLFKKNIENYSEKSMITIDHPNSTNSSISLNIVQVKTMHPYPSLLIIFNAEKLPYPSSQLAIEQASTVISFTLLKNEAIRESSRLLENNFFGSLVEGNIDLKEEIIYRGKQHGLIEKAKYLCIVFQIDGEKQDTFLQSDLMTRNRSYDFLYELFKKSIIKINKESILFIKNRFFVSIIQMTNDCLLTSIKKELEAFQEEAYNTLKVSLSFGVGNFVNDVTYIPITYSEAVDAWKQGEELYQRKFINLYETKQLIELIHLIPKENLKNFYENTLRSLAYPKTKDEEDLINTLIVFLENNCEITITSKKLFIHRNTVKYRIAKCEGILGYLVHEPQNSLHLRMALLMRPIFTKTGGI